MVALVGVAVGMLVLLVQVCLVLEMTGEPWPLAAVEEVAVLAL